MLAVKGDLFHSKLELSVFSHRNTVINDSLPIFKIISFLFLQSMDEKEDPGKLNNFSQDYTASIMITPRYLDH